MRLASRAVARIGAPAYLRGMSTLGTVLDHLKAERAQLEENIGWLDSRTMTTSHERDGRNVDTTAETAAYYRKQLTDLNILIATVERDLA